MNLALELILLLLTLPLIYHSVHKYGGERTYIFWSAGLVFGITREFTLSSIAGLYHFHDFLFVVRELPLIYMVFWTNMAYIAWQWSNNLLDRDYFASSSFDQHQPLIFLILVFISFMIETAFSQYGMITWNVDSVKMLWENTPLLSPFAYGFSGSLFLKGLKIMSKHEGSPLVRRVWNTSIIQPVLILVLMGLLLLTNTSIVLFFS